MITGFKVKENQICGSPDRAGELNMYVFQQVQVAGPDGVSSRVLKTCAEQLCGILQHLFNLSSLSQ